MEYLKAFTIGTSGIVFLSNLYVLKLTDEEVYDFPLKLYSLLIPLYYGLMNVLGLYIGKKFKLSLDIQLLIISLISITTIVLFNYYYSRRKYKPYKNYTKKEWFLYIIRNGLRHLFAFNIVIYFFTKYFDSSLLLKWFIIGSSFFSYYQTYLKVAWIDEKKPGYIQYNYKDFITFEPIVHGIFWTVGLYIFYKNMKYTILKSLILWSILGMIGQFGLAKYFKTYDYSKRPESKYILSMVVSSVIQIIPLNYLIHNL